MNWTDFKEKHLFSVNVALIASVVLFHFRRDFTYHGVLVFWPLLTAFFPKLRIHEVRFFGIVGRVNSTLILTFFYFLFFTPYSLFYRQLFRGNSFKKKNSTFVEKSSISDFDRPF